MPKSDILNIVYVVSYLGAYFWLLISDTITPKDSKFKEYFKGAWISLIIVGVIFFILSVVVLVLGWAND